MASTSRRTSLLALAFVAIANATAFANPFLFGFSSDAGQQSLFINGVEFETSDSQFTPGVDNQGWWSPTMPAFDDNDNYFVGVNGANVINNFFTFDLSDFSGGATSAELRLSRGGCCPHTAGPLPFLYALHDVSTAAEVLNNNTGTSVAIFNDLRSGALFGSINVNDMFNPDPLVILLNADALAQIDASAGEFFSIGGTVIPSQTPPVPEPAVVSLLFIGSGAAIRWRYQAARRVRQ